MKLPLFIISLIFASSLQAGDIEIDATPSVGGDFAIYAEGAPADKVWKSLLKKEAKASLSWQRRFYNRGDSDDWCELRLEIASVQCSFTYHDKEGKKSHFEFGYGERGLCGTADLLSEIRVRRDSGSASANLTLAEAELLTERLNRMRHPHPKCTLRVR